LALLTNAVDDPPRHVHPDLLGILYGLDEQLAAIERRLALDDDPYQALVARIDELETRLEARPFLPPFGAAALRELVGAPTAVGLTPVADRLVGHEPVLDLRSGDGVLLGLLRQRGVRAEGVEADAELRDRATADGLLVHPGDGIDHLARLPEVVGGGAEGLGAIVAVGVVERLAPQALVELVTLAATRLRSGGRLVIGTPNPQSLALQARATGLDPTVLGWVHPDYLRFLLLQVGFAEIEIVDVDPASLAEPLLEVPADAPAAAVVNANTARLNRLLFAPQDVLLVATR
jgi:SAM-dependent methyltransferase